MTQLIKYYYDYFIDENKNGYLLLSSAVCISICNGMYKKFMKDGIMPIELISKEQKERLWEQAKIYYGDREQRILAMKAGYVLELITSKD